MRVRLPPSAPKKQVTLLGYLLFNYLEGSRTLRGQRARRKRLIIVFREVGAKTGTANGVCGRQAGKMRSICLPPSAPKKQVTLLGYLLFNYLEGSRTLRGQRARRKRLIIVFCEVGAKTGTASNMENQCFYLKNKSISISDIYHNILYLALKNRT